jgi:hypothetical protein
MTRNGWILAALLAAAAALRFPGLDWGLPWALHIDERLFVVAKAIRLEQSLSAGGPPDPGISSYGILPLWLLVLARKLFLPLAAQPGPPTYGDAFAATVLLARWVSAIWGVATVLLVWLWARRWHPVTGLLAAAIVAGMPALVQTSHFGTVEAPLVALLVTGMWMAERIADRPTLVRCTLGGIVLGLAVSVKAPGVLLVLPMLHASLHDRFRTFVIRVLPMLLVAGLVAVILNPALLLGGIGETHAGEHTTLFGNLRRAYSADFHDWTLPYAKDIPGWTELTKLLPYGAGPVAAILSLVGLVLALRRRRPADVRLLLLLLPLLALLLPARVKTMRFLLPAFPLLAVLAADAVTTLLPRPRRRAILAVAVALVTLLVGASYLPVWTGEDPRVQAAFWLDEHVGPRETVAVEDPAGYGPPIGSPTPELPRPSMRYEILWFNFYTGHERAGQAERRTHLERVLRRCDWLVLSEGHRVEFTTAPELRPVESAFYADLDAGRLPFTKAMEFRNPPRLGPLEIPDRGAEVLFRVFDHPVIEVWRRTEPRS